MCGAGCEARPTRVHDTSMLRSLTRVAVIGCLLVAGCGGDDKTTTGAATPTASAGPTADPRGNPDSLPIADKFLAPRNLKQGQRKSDVRKAFGPPFLEDRAGSSRCDVYRLANEGYPAASRYLHICFDGDDLINVITFPYNPFDKKLPPPKKKHKIGG
jgi:hypothetical protein